MGQAAGKHWLQQVKLAVVRRVIAREPIDLFGQVVRGRLAAQPHQTTKRRKQGLGGCRVIMQGLGQVFVLDLHPIQEPLTVDLKLQELEDVQRGGIAHHIRCKVLTQKVESFLIGVMLNGWQSM